MCVRKAIISKYFSHCEAFFAEAISSVSCYNLKDCFAPLSLAVTTNALILKAFGQTLTRFEKRNNKLCKRCGSFGMVYHGLSSYFTSASLITSIYSINRLLQYILIFSFECLYNTFTVYAF